MCLCTQFTYIGLGEANGFSNTRLSALEHYIYCIHVPIDIETKTHEFWYQSIRCENIRKYCVAISIFYDVRHISKYDRWGIC